jgi:excisionase family DNA binding protein
MDEVMTLEEVAAYLRVHVDTVRRWAREGSLPAVKLGKAYRVAHSDLKAWWQARLEQQARHDVQLTPDGERSGVQP